MFDCPPLGALHCLALRARQNFLVSMAEAQLNLELQDAAGRPTPAAEVIDTINVAFNALFAAELALNLYSHWFLAFFGNAWSILDLAVVLLSLLAAGLPISALRLIRAFRVIRLFGRLGALKKIVSALSSSIVPMLNAFLILFVVLAICESRLSRSPSFLAARRMRATARKRPRTHFEGRAST